MLKQRDDEHRKNPETNIQEIVSPFQLPYSKINAETLKIKVYDTGSRCTSIQYIYWFVICRLNYLPVTLHMDSFSVFIFKSRMFISIKSVNLFYLKRLWAFSTPAISMKTVIIHFSRWAILVREVHLVIYTFMNEMRQFIKHQWTDQLKLIVLTSTHTF